MGKNAKIIIFSLIGLIILGGVAALLIFTAPKKDEPVVNNDFAEPVSASDKADLKLCGRDEKDIASITVNNRLDSFSITPSGNIDSNGKVIWTIADIASAPLNADTLSTAAKYACAFDAKEFAEKVSDSSELAKYGLDKPITMFKTTFSDGSEFMISVGSDVPNSATTVYVTPDGENVYTAYRSRISSFTGNRYSFIDLAAMPGYDQSGNEEVLRFTVERVGLDTPLVLENVIVGDGDEDENAIKVYSYRMTSPYEAYVDLTDGPAFAYSIFGLTASSVSSIKGKSDPNYASFGLDDPVCTVTAETNIRTYTIKIGAPVYTTEKDDEGNDKQVLSGYYGTSSEHPDIVYLFDKSSVSGFVIDPAKLISKLFLMPYIYDLESIDYSDTDGHKLDLGIKLIQKADAAENKEEISEFTVNGEKWDEHAFKNIYQYLIAAAGEELYLDEDKGDLIAEVVYNYIDKTKGFGGKDTVRFYTSNADRKVIIELNGENVFKTRRLYATQLLSNIESFLNGGEIILTY